MSIFDNVRFYLFDDQWWTSHQDPALADYMSGSPGWLVSIIVIYLILVLGVGPAFMRHRKPYDVSTAMKVYNVSNIFFNIVLVIMGARFTRFGVASFTCTKDGDFIDRYALSFGYLALKVS